MKRRMSLAVRKELIAVVRRRYSESDREGKKVMLDEITKITRRYHPRHQDSYWAGTDDTAGAPVPTHIEADASSAGSKPATRRTY